jgi:Domain of unknown function (DUF4034)
MSTSKALLVVLSFGLCAGAGAADGNPDGPEIPRSPEELGQRHVAAGQWSELDALIGRLAASGERSADGRFQLQLLTAGVDRWFQRQGEGQDETLRAKFAEYAAQQPQSAFAPILAAMHVHATAWRARGRGYVSSVTPEQWTLFRARAKTAWEMMLACKPRSSILSTWYDRAIAIGLDAEVPAETLTKLFNEGVERFPGDHALYFSYLRQFSPRWGGDYQSADAFIRDQVEARTNPEGEVLYTRLYWLLDQYDGSFGALFSKSLVSWPRMRTGFDLLMQQFPDSPRNRVNYMLFACRAGDAGTYAKLRSTVHVDQVSDAAPNGISLGFCDARFKPKA